MVARVTSWLWRPGLLRMLLSHARLAGRLLREPRVSFLTKAVPLIAALYLVSPFDLVPDVLPVLGQIDDLSLILIALTVFLKLGSPATVAFHRAAIAEGRRYIRCRQPTTSSTPSGGVSRTRT
ncbi:MAG: DUF1232 domain-containing protein [Gemmatimonadota bacterium]